MTTPGYVSNAQLAQRISTLVDRWDTRETEMVDLLTQESGEVTVTDGLGRKHTLPSMRQLIASVTEMVGELTGESAKAAQFAQDALGYMQSAGRLADTAREHRDSAASHVQAAKMHVDAARSQADLASAHLQGAACEADRAEDAAYVAEDWADTARGHVRDANTAAAQAASHSGSSATSASASASSAANATASAQNAAVRALEAAEAVVQAQQARDTANSFANAPQDTEVAPGEYSARHWAAKASASVTGAIVYMGTWNAATGSFPASPTRGHFYRVTGKGTVGGIDWNPSDQALYSGTAWEKIDNTDSVTSVAGKQGAVQLVSSDIGGLGVLATRDAADWGSQVANKPSTYPAAAHTHSWSEVTGKPSTFPASSHGHAWSDLHSVPAHLLSWAGVAPATKVTVGAPFASIDVTGASLLGSFRLVEDAAGNYMQSGDGRQGRSWKNLRIGPYGEASYYLEVRSQGIHTPGYLLANGNIHADGFLTAAGGRIYGAAAGETFLIGGSGAVAIRPNGWTHSGQTVFNTDGSVALSGPLHRGALRLDSGSGAGQLLVATSNGELRLGPNNSQWCHFSTDRPSFHFDKPVAFGGGAEFYNGPRVPRTFVQGHDPGGAAGEGDLWLW